MTREQFNARWKEGSKRWQGGGIGLHDCMWATFYRELSAASESTAPREAELEAFVKECVAELGLSYVEAMFRKVAKMRKGEPQGPASNG